MDSTASAAYWHDADGRNQTTRLKQAMVEVSDILSHVDQAKALISIRQRWDAIEVKLSDTKSQDHAKQVN